ncbi:MAG: SIMPL domain-containing protein, partial [Nitrososphaeraceae archaeon]
MFGTNYNLINSITPLAFNNDRKVLLSSITILLLASFLCMSITNQDINVVAQSTPNDALSNNGTDTTNENSTVFATGSGLSRLAPDRVFISVGVETTDKTANDALSLNSGLMNSIISELRSDGLKPNETSTTFFNIFPLFNYTESGTRLNVTGFTVT